MYKILIFLSSYSSQFSSKIWSGKRGSNPRPSAWKADALAIELFPHATVVPRQILSPTAKAVFVNATILLHGREIVVVEGGGFEPPKSYDDRFTVCSLWPLGNPSTFACKVRNTVLCSAFCGAGDGTRTRNLLITNQLLCQLSYASNKSFLYPLPENLARKKYLPGDFAENVDASWKWMLPTAAQRPLLKSCGPGCNALSRPDPAGW